MTPLERLIARLLRARRWPVPGEEQVRARIRLWAALRESDEPYLRSLMKWPGDRPLIIDNLPEKIASAYGDLLFGQAPTYTPADPADAERMQEMTETWAGELPGAEETCVSEGEVWWRLSLDGVTPHPIVTWHSRVDVVPLLHGRTVLAVAFVSQLDTTQQGVVWRHLEVHGAGVVRNLLFRGRAEALGAQVDLARHPDTADLVDEWNHGLPILAGRIVNAWGRRPVVGRSIYHGVWTQFLSLNEATTIGRENMRLTAKKRAVVPASSLRARRTIDGGDGAIRAGADLGDGGYERIQAPAVEFDAGEDILVHDPLDADEGGMNAPFKILEYSFDAASLIAYKQDLVETCCMRCDLVPQFIGSGDFGQGNTGTALKVRLLPTTNAADSRGRPWDEEQPRIAQRGALLEALPVALGGIGREEWVNAGGTPVVERAEPLPPDENEVARRHADLKTAGLVSIETSLRERYPGRDDTWYAEEVARIHADEQATLPAFGPPGPPAGPGD
jgi:hypothetical protein